MICYKGTANVTQQILKKNSFAKTEIQWYDSQLSSVMCNWIAFYPSTRKHAPSMLRPSKWRILDSAFSCYLIGTHIQLVPFISSVNICCVFMGHRRLSTTPTESSQQATTDIQPTGYSWHPVTRLQLTSSQQATTDIQPKGYNWHPVNRLQLTSSQ